MREIIEETPNGRYIYLRDGKYEVQPKNDNYWIRVATPEETRDAYEHPEKYRQ